MTVLPIVRYIKYRQVFKGKGEQIMKKGLIAAIILALAVMLISGCADVIPPSGEEKELTEGEETITGLSTGTIKVLVTDAPGDVSEVNVTVSSVEVHKTGSDGASGEWISLPIQQETFNLIALQDISMLLAEGTAVDAGKYTQLRMTVFDVIVKTEGGPEEGYQATVPSKELKFVRPFTLKAGGEITLTVDIDAAKSVLFPGGKKGDVRKVIFKPVVKLMIEHEEESGPSLATYFDPINGPAETVITVTGTGWVSSEAIDSVTIGVEVATHVLVVDDEGNLSGTITVPVGLAPGTYSIWYP
jgi:hypothetical protein